MKSIIGLNKPTLKTVKVNEVERPVIEVKLVMPYTTENWAYVGAHAGESLSAEFVPAQHDMFETVDGNGEIRSARR